MKLYKIEIIVSIGKKKGTTKLVTIKSKKEIELMKQVCKIVALTYEEL